MWLEPLLLGGDGMILKYHKLKFNPKYIISNKGFIISLVGKFHLLNIRRDKNGYAHYYIIDLSTGKRKDFKGHRLVAEYFIDNPNDYPIVNHIDGDKSNNHIENLEWCTYSQNNIHAYKNGLNTSKKKQCTINGINYESITEAANQLGVSRKTIHNWSKCD